VGDEASELHAPVPGGFGASAAEYRDGLIGELEQLAAPVDRVGHDWGGGMAMQVAMTRPELLRSWVSDATGVFGPDHVRHDLAQTCSSREPARSSPTP
jgi:pimeloyl-ACP methyl ester carboxylesterase